MRPYSTLAGEEPRASEVRAGRARRGIGLSVAARKNLFPEGVYVQA
jgi:hypothetical protein